MPWKKLEKRFFFDKIHFEFFFRNITKVSVKKKDIQIRFHE